MDRWRSIVRAWVARHPLGTALLVNLVLFAAFYARYTPRFMTNDDVGMLLRVAGVSQVAEPTAHLWFTHVLIGHALRALYRLTHAVPWYALYLVGCLFVAHTAVLVLALRQLPWPRSLLLYLVGFGLLGTYTLLHLQFTIAAGLVALAGLALLLADDGGPVRHAAGAALLALGAMIRLDAAILAAALLAPAAVLRFLAPPRRAAGARLAALAAGLSAGVLLCAGDRAVYARDPAWQAFRAFNGPRLQVTDYGALADAPPAALARAGWSENDLELLRNWFWAYDGVYTAARLRAALDAAPRRPTPARWRTALRPVVGLLRTDTARNALLLAVFAACLLRADRGGWLRLGAVVGALAVLAFAVALLRKPPPPRVYVPMFWALAWLPLLLPAAERVARPLGLRRLAAAGLVLVLLLVQARRVGASLAWHSDEALAEAAGLRRTLAELAPRPDRLYVVWGAAFPWTAVLPFDALRDLQDFRTFSLGIGQDAPDERAVLRRFGIADLPAALVARDDVFLLCPQDDTLLRRFAAFMREHYGWDVRAATVFTGPTFRVCKLRRG